MSDSQMGQTGKRGSGKRKWIVHSHEAFRPAASASMSEINITPMIDVLLVLLIIFMVVTPVAQKGLDIALPQANTQKEDEPQNTPSDQVVLVMETTLDGTELLSVNKQPVAGFGDLGRMLRETFQARTEKTMFVRAAGGVEYGRVVKAMDVAKGAGVVRIGIISEKMIEDAAEAAGLGEIEEDDPVE